MSPLPWWKKCTCSYPCAQAFCRWFLNRNWCVMVAFTTTYWRLIDREQISTNSGFGGIHGTILNLATRCLSSGRWTRSVKPQTDAEVLDASVYASGKFSSLHFSQRKNNQISGYGTDTKFDISVRQKERLLRKAIITYIGTASQFTGAGQTLCHSLLEAKKNE